MKHEIVIATCQFPVSGKIEKNLAFILDLIMKAKQKGAEIVHFSESCLSGYAGVDFSTFNQHQETLLKKSLNQVAALAAKLKTWIILGSHYFVNKKIKPYNCLWLIDESGSLVERYDKRFLYGGPNELEHAHYQAGKRPVTFMVKGIQCGLLICHEWRYPELYREQIRLGTKLVFQSWYDGNLTLEDFEDHGREQGTLITGTVRGYAANNYLWISASNTSKRQSCFPSFVVQPDGKVLHHLKRNVTGMLLTRVDFRQQFDDPSGPWRPQAMQGIRYDGNVEAM